MKSPFAAFLFTAIVSLSTGIAAELSVPVRVEQANQSPPISKTGKTQKRSLRVFLSNPTHEELSLKVKYAYFGHGAKDHAVIVVDQGEVAATLKPSGTQQVDTPPVTSTYVLEHVDKKTKVPASGNVLSGYGVQVYLGDKLVGESYEPLSMKTEMGKGPEAVKAAPALGKK